MVITELNIWKWVGLCVIIYWLNLYSYPSHKKLLWMVYNNPVKQPIYKTTNVKVYKPIFKVQHYKTNLQTLGRKRIKNSHLSNCANVLSKQVSNYLEAPLLITQPGFKGLNALVSCQGLQTSVILKDILFHIFPLHWI